MGKSLKGKELGKGISQRKDGIYQARFINRFGKQQTIYAGTYTDITKKLRTEMYMDEKQINVVNSTMTLDEWYDSWINVCKTHCRDTTKRTYAIQYNRLREELGWRKLSQLNLVILQDAFNQLATDTMRADCKSLLVDMLNRAVETELLNKNIALGTGMRMGDDDDKIRLNQRKPSKYKGLSRFGPEKNLQRINKFMKERPTFYKKLIQMKENFRFYLRCFYCITKVVILQFNSEKQDRISS